MVNRKRGIQSCCDTDNSAVSWSVLGIPEVLTAVE